MKKEFQVLFKTKTRAEALAYLNEHKPQEHIEFYIEEENTYVKNDLTTNTLRGSSSSQLIKLFPKDNTITNEHIGLLAMQKVKILNYPPQSVNDIELVASLADTTPAVPGVKGRFKLTFPGVRIEQPKSKVIRMTFIENRNVNNDHRIVFRNNTNQQDLGFILFVNPGQVDLQNNRVEVGATLTDTINNLIAHFDARQSPLTQNYVTIAGTGIGDNNQTYIDFEMLYNEGFVGADKYTNDTSIVLEYQEERGFLETVYPIDAILGQSNGTIRNSYYDLASITLETIPTDLLYYKILTIAGQDVSSYYLYVANLDGYNTIHNFNSNTITYDIPPVIQTESGDIIIGEMISPIIIINEAFPEWYPIEDIFQLTIHQYLSDIDVVNLAQSISKSSNYILRFRSWDTDQRDLPLISSQRLYNSEYQVNGIEGAFGLMYFEDDNKTISAIQHALQNSSQNPNWFNQAFDVEKGLHVAGDTGEITMIVVNKSAPIDNPNCDIYIPMSNIANFVNVEQLTNPEVGTVEKIDYTILGVIDSIDGDNVAIDMSNIANLKMSSDSLTTCAYTPTLYEDMPAILLAWRQGTVIDIQGLYYIISQQSVQSYLEKASYIRGIFRAMTASGPGGNILGEYIAFIGD